MSERAASRAAAAAAQATAERNAFLRQLEEEEAKFQKELLRREEQEIAAIAASAASERDQRRKLRKERILSAAKDGEKEALVGPDPRIVPLDRNRTQGATRPSAVRPVPVGKPRKGGRAVALKKALAAVSKQ